MQGHPNFSVALNNMVIRNHMPLFLYDSPGPETRLDAVALLKPLTIAIDDTLTLQNFGIDTHHRRCYSVDKFHHLVISPD